MIKRTGFIGITAALIVAAATFHPRRERLRAFDDDGEVYVGYSAKEIMDELNVNEAYWGGERRDPRELSLVPPGTVYENEDTNERVDVDRALRSIERRLHDVPRTDPRNRGLVDQLWTYYG